MKIQFDSQQQYQLDAVNAVVKVYPLAKQVSEDEQKLYSFFHFSELWGCGGGAPTQGFHP